MKLLGKFSEIIGFQSTLRDNFEKSKAIHKIADDYAIEFSKWMSKNSFYYHELSIWNKESKKYSEKELLEIFKKEKGL